MESKNELSCEKALHIRDQFREARLIALKDAEAFHEILYTLERLGYLLKGAEGNLWEYQEDIEVEASSSALAVEIPEAEHREWHTPFPDLYYLVRVARNDALHQGAFARNLTMHATQLALVLEDALTERATTIGDFMVRGAVCALPWQPISFVRQQMLANSFSYLPMQWETEEGTAWKLVSDFHVARYLRATENPSSSERKRRLARTVQDAANAGILVLEEAASCSSQNTLVLCQRSMDG